VWFWAVGGGKSRIGKHFMGCSDFPNCRYTGNIEIFKGGVNS